jgi:hypothetical protein
MDKENEELSPDEAMTESMEKTFDEIEARDAEPETDEKPAAEESPEESDTPKAEASADEEPAAEESEAEDQPEGKDTPEPDGEPESVEAPEYWSDDTRTQFDALPDDAKLLVLESAKGAKADYTRKTQELALQTKTTAPMQGVLDQWQGYLEQRGATPEQAFNALMQTEYALRTGTPEQKRQAMDKLQADYGISNAAPEDEEYRDPELASLEGQIQALSSQISQGQQAQENAQMAQAISTVEQFKAAQDDKGNVLYPHFNEVEGTMTALVSSGQVQDLQHAYELAVYTNPTIREQLVNEQISKAKANAKVGTDKAKKAAAVNVKWDDDGAMGEIYDNAS